ncbi:outer membrane protein assembly factor BamE [Endozoicomonadaceae bacterium StTr2]
MIQTKLLPLAAILTSAVLSGCAGWADTEQRTLGFPGAYRINIQQGNIITQDMIDKLKPGMTRNQVRFVLGNPLLEDTFNQDRWDFVYSIQKGNKPREQQTLTILFEGDSLAGFSGDFVPGMTPGQ